MKRAIQTTLGLLAFAAVVGWNATVSAADTQFDKVTHGNTHRVSRLIGLSVHNEQGERVGTIEDFVVNMQNGQISYAALGYGGVLGIGEKLFAVPFNQMKLTHSTDGDTYFVINVSKEKLKAPPGFDKTHWPDFADPNWSREIDKYYQQTGNTTTTTTVTTSEKK